MHKYVINLLPLVAIAVGVVQYLRLNDERLSIMLCLIGFITALSYRFMSSRLAAVSDWSEAFAWLVQLIVFAGHMSVFALLFAIGFDSKFSEILPLMVLVFGGASLIYALVLNRPIVADPTE